MIFYDFEVFKYDWLVVFKDMIEKTEKIIVNSNEELKEFYEANKHRIFVGFNNKHYDQWIFKAIVCGFNPKEVNDFIIVGNQPGYAFSGLLNKVYMINYDIFTGFTGLKQLEAFMGHNIKETGVSFTIDRKLTKLELDETIKYCQHDVDETIEVFLQNIHIFQSKMDLIKEFKLPINNIQKSEAQLSAIILDARRIHGRNDEFDLVLPDTLKLSKYKFIADWYLDKNNRNYKNELEVNVAGVPHKFAWGGIHGAIKQYHGEGYFLNIDVASYYPALMIEYGFLSRNVKDPKKYTEIRNTRLELKKKKDKRQSSYKLVLNGTYGAMKDKFNDLYDPLQANNVCVGGQLLLLDLIEKLEGHCQIIQSNTDGILLKLYSESDFDKIDDICYEWESRTRMVLEFEHVSKVYQKDVNNYVTVDYDGNYKSKGAYVKKLNKLDYDLPILNEALIEYFLHGTHPKETIHKCNELYKFQKISKMTSKYKYVMHNNKILNEKTFRTFASLNVLDGSLYKCKENKNPEKFPNTAINCFINNYNVLGKKCPSKLDKNWYIDFAIKRLSDFGIIL